MAECRGDQGGELGEEAKDRSGRRGAAKYIPAGCAVAAFNKLASNKEGTESQEITIEVKSKTKQWGKKITRNTITSAQGLYRRTGHG